MKDILIITSYFPPETGAASNRIFHLAGGLQNNKFKVSVLTPLPNYPTGKIFKSYRGKFRSTSKEKEITIHRLWIFASNSKNKLIRLIAMLSYSLSLTLYFISHKIPKKVIVQSPPLIVAFTCCLFLRSKRRQLILNVSDLWPRAGLELGALKKNISYKFLERIERFNYKTANLVLGQSDEIIQHVKTLFPEKPCFLYRNYPDFLVMDPPKVVCSSKIKVVYAGLLGVAQGILKLCQQLDYQNIELHIYGAGAEQSEIEEFIKLHPELPIVFHGELSRQELHRALLAYDLGIIPLLNRIYGSVPSKIFEYGKLGLPMLYFGGGEGEQIIKEYQLGWVVPAGDYSALNEQLALFEKTQLNETLKIQIKKNSEIHFNFDNQLKALVEIL